MYNSRRITNTHWRWIIASEKIKNVRFLSCLSDKLMVETASFKW